DAEINAHRRHHRRLQGIPVGNQRRPRVDPVADHGLYTNKDLSQCCYDNAVFAG
ncbi:uncharacterized, partial [Tachysurus ichikawai]